MIPTIFNIFTCDYPFLLRHMILDKNRIIKFKKEGYIMKKIAVIAAKFVKKAAVIAGGQASQWGGYQPKEPKNLKK